MSLSIKDTVLIARAEELVPGAFHATVRVRALRVLVWSVLICLTAWCLYAFNFAPARIVEGLSRLGRIIAFMFPPHLWETWAEWQVMLNALGETVAIAFVGTLLGAAVAFPLAFLGAKNIVHIGWLRLLARRGFDAVRAIEQLILALIFIRAFGLGPLAGIFAIAVSEIGTLAKLFSEAIENTSQKPVEGVRASGGGPLQTIRFAILPQALPVMLSIVLYNFESNIRTGTILGIVGAGGIGFLLSDRIYAYHWPEAWTMIFMIIATVYIIDGISGWLRHRIIGKSEGVR